MSRRIEATTSMDDLQADPKAYGLPTYEEFSKNPHFWRERKDRSMSALDAGFTASKLKNMMSKMKFKIHGKSVPSIEYAERAILDNGYTLEDFELGKSGKDSKLKYEMNMIPQGAGKYDVEVNFLP